MWTPSKHNIKIKEVLSLKDSNSSLHDTLWNKDCEKIDENLTRDDLDITRFEKEALLQDFEDATAEEELYSIDNEDEIQKDMELCEEEEVQNELGLCQEDLDNDLELCHVEDDAIEVCYTDERASSKECGSSLTLESVFDDSEVHKFKNRAIRNGLEIFRIKGDTSGDSKPEKENLSEDDVEITYIGKGNTQSDPKDALTSEEIQTSDDDQNASLQGELSVAPNFLEQFPMYTQDSNLLYKQVGTAYECQECGLYYQNARNLRRHCKSAHEGLHPYQCKICGEHFRWANDLQRHVFSTHEGRQPFFCNLCDKSFAYMVSLKRHKLTVHDGLRPYACSICGKRFGQSGSVRHHVKTVHLNLRPHVCSECGKGFLVASKLVRHIVNVHHNVSVVSFQG